MQFDKVISRRKSIRSFEEKSVPKNILTKLVKDATKAPSSSNSQPWKFYIITSKKQRNQVAELMHKVYLKYQKEFEAKPSPIVKISREFYKNMGDCQNVVFIYTEKNSNRFESNITNISLAAENLMLSAVNKGLGSCWVGSLKFYEKEITKICGAKKGEVLIASILIGYPKKGYKPLKRDKKKVSQVLKFV